MNWNMTGGIPKILGIDARVFVTIPVVLILQMWLLLFLQLVLFVGAFFIQKKGYTIEIFYFAMRRKLSGNVLAPFPQSYIEKHDESY